VKLWLQRAQDGSARSACLYCAGAFELDDRDGPLHDLLLSGVRRWRMALKRTVIQAIDEGHLPADRDAEQMVFELDALFIGAMRDIRFLRDPKAPERTWRAYERLVSAGRGASGVAVSVS
jgi:hypothetical protein